MNTSLKKGVQNEIKLDFPMLLWICFAGSFMGVVIELLWEWIHDGNFESRSGLVYGPFNLLYGVGAVALTLALHHFRNRSGWISFAGGMIVGSAVEYLCSWGQEMFFGSRSWDYSGHHFNLNGRICLTYAFYWGILGYLWIKCIYPRFASIIMKLPERVRMIAPRIILLFFAVNSIITCVTVYRWTDRMDGAADPSPFWSLVDSRFPDERMERIFANMNFGEK